MKRLDIISIIQWRPPDQVKEQMLQDLYRNYDHLIQQGLVVMKHLEQLRAMEVLDNDDALNSKQLERKHLMAEKRWRHHRQKK